MVNPQTHTLEIHEKHNNCGAFDPSLHMISLAIR